MSTQTLQPLIWLARNSTRPSVRDGTPPFSADALRACRACMASGTTIAMFLIRASIIALLFQGLISGLYLYDEWGKSKPDISTAAPRLNRGTKGMPSVSNTLAAATLIVCRVQPDGGATRR